MSPEFLKWVLENDFDPVELADKRLWRVSVKDKVMGFVMTRVSNMGARVRVVEWQAVPGEEKEIPWMILAAAFKALGGHSAVVISVDSNDKGLVSTLRRLLPRLPDQAATVNVSAGSPLERHEGWKDQANWRIRPIMGDCAFY